jgi:hypothetical protein
MAKAENQQLQKAGKQHADKEAAATKTLGGMGVTPDYLTGLGVKNPAHYLHELQTGKGPAYKQLNLLGAISKRYQQPQDKLTSALEGDLQTAEQDLDAQVNLQKQEDPLLGQMNDYFTSRLGTGLTPDEESAMRGELRAPVESAYNTAVRSAGQAGATAGIAPGSGVSIAQGQQAQQQRQQGESNVENEIVQANLQRQQEIEQEAAGQESTAEGARTEDIGAQQAQQQLQLRQLALAEGGLGGISSLAEGEREFDVSETEAKRQAWLARQMWQKAGAAMQPSTMEDIAQGIGGFLGGVGMG